MTSRPLHRLALLGLVLLVALAGAPARAAGLLEIVAVRDGASQRIELDRDAFAALPQTTLVTATPWTEGQTRFSGVLLRDLLASLDLTAETVVARALNDYEARIPVQDFQEFDVLIADRLDGATMAVRDKGPLWIIYPLSDHPELRSPDTEAKMVWQLFRLTIE